MLTLSLLLSACGGDPQPGTTAPAETSSPTTTTAPTTVPTESETEAPWTLEDLASYMDENLSAIDSATYHVTVEDGALTISISSAEIDSFVSTIKGSPAVYADSWEQIKSSTILSGLHESAQSLADSCGLGSIEVVTSLVNSTDPSDVYASATDGVLTFDAVAAVSATASSWYESGAYKVGSDLPAGEYYLEATEGSAYFCVSSDSTGDSILYNDNFSGGVYITVEDGQYFSVKWAHFAPVADVTRPVDPDSLSDGLYRVGTDIPAGEYKFQATDDTGYFCVFDNSTVDRDIVTNDLFEGSQYVTVQDGQYLELSFCTGALVG